MRPKEMHYGVFEGHPTVLCHYEGGQIAGYSHGEHGWRKLQEPELLEAFHETRLIKGGKEGFQQTYPEAGLPPLP